MGDQLLLIDIPVTGHKASKAKPADIEINRVNRRLAKRRYYWHKQLTNEFIVFASIREIKAPYKCFTDIPVGPRYAIGKLLKLGYIIQYEIF